METSKLQTLREVEDLYLVVSSHIANNNITKINEYFGANVRIIVVKF